MFGTTFETRFGAEKVTLENLVVRLLEYQATDIPLLKIVKQSNTNCPNSWTVVGLL